MLPGSPARLFALALAAAIMGGCAATGEVAPPAAETDPPSTTTVAAPSTTLVATTTTSTRPSTTTTVVETTTTTALTAETLGPDESLAARADEALPVFAAPGDDEPILVLEPATDLGTPRVVRVLEGPRNGWMRVALPVRPNGSEGWIAEDQVSLFRLDRRVEVSLGDRTLRVVSDDETLLETRVAIGGEESPTPVGTFYVTDSVIVGDGGGGPWGPHAFGLSAFSDTITEFNGGDGIIGIHGTNRPDSIGHAQSLGCVRVPNEVASQLADMISAGVVVEIKG